MISKSSVPFSLWPQLLTSILGHILYVSKSQNSKLSERIRWRRKIFGLLRTYLLHQLFPFNLWKDYLHKGLPLSALETILIFELLSLTLQLCSKIFALSNQNFSQCFSWQRQEVQGLRVPFFPDLRYMNFFICVSSCVPQ